jgi:hypothetical protein
MRARRMWVLSSLISAWSLWGTPGCMPEGVSFESPDAGDVTVTGTGGDTSEPDPASGGATQTGGAPGTATGGATVKPPGTGGAATSTGGRTGSGAGGRSASGGRTATGGAAMTMTGGRGGAAGPGSGGAIVVGSGGAAGAAAGEIIFSGDFETGDLSQWAYVERCATDRITIYSTANMPAGAPAPRQGQYAARFHVLDTDVSPCTSTENPRAEVETPETLFKPGDDRWEAWSMYLPATLPAPLRNQGWFVFQEDYGAPWDGSPSIGWNLDLVNNPKRFRIDRGDQYGHDQPGTSTMILGHWVDFLVHKKFANTANGGGFVEVWIDGMPMTFNASGCTNCTRLMMQTMHTTQKSVGFYLSTYRERGFFSSFDVYYDAVRIGTTRAAVELPR